jgi:hypothetical protein
LLQEEYIKEEQKNLKNELLRAQEEVKRIQVQHSPPLAATHPPHPPPQPPLQCFSEPLRALLITHYSCRLCR